MNGYLNGHEITFQELPKIEIERLKYFPNWCFDASDTVSFESGKFELITKNLKFQIDGFILARKRTVPPFCSFYMVINNFIVHCTDSFLPFDQTFLITDFL